MSTIKASNIQNLASGIVNIQLNADGTTNFGNNVTFAPSQTFSSASSITPPADPQIGSTWYDTSTNPRTFKIYTGVEWVSVPQSSSTTTPTNPYLGQIWIDTSVVPYIQKIWNGTVWAPSTVPFGPVTPIGTQRGQLWSDTNTTPATLKTWTGTAWEPVFAGIAPTSGVQSFSAGTTGLTPTASATGVITLGGVLAVANGGTGATSLAGLQTAALPVQTGQSGKYLTTDGTVSSWVDLPSSAGTVSSVDVTGGSTGLTFTGGPITTSGTISMGGSLSISSGGTGATSAAAALTALGAYASIGGNISGRVSGTVYTITGAGWDLSNGNFWTIGSAIDVPQPTGAAAGQSGLILVTTVPNSWPATGTGVLKYVAGTAPSLSATPAVIPYYSDGVSVFLGNPTQDII